MTHGMNSEPPAPDEETASNDTDVDLSDIHVFFAQDGQVYLGEGETIESAEAEVRSELVEDPDAEYKLWHEQTLDEAVERATEEGCAQVTF